MLIIVAALVFPGFGFIIPLALAGGEDVPWGFVPWAAAWGGLAYAGARNARRLTLVEDRLTVEAPFRATEVIDTVNIVEIAPSRWRLPMVVARTSNGRRIRLGQAGDLVAFADALGAASPHALNTVPPGKKWLRNRRLLWFALLFVAGAAQG